MSASNGQTFVNGKIFTGRSEDEFVSAFRIANGKIAWIGNSSDVDAAGAIDLKAQTVLPGFLDVHTHPAFVAMTVRAVPCTVPVVNNIAEMIAALKTHSNFGKGDKDWIQGWGYDESKLAEHRSPTTNDLDQVSTTQPVYVLRSDCHSGICNTRALQLAGITKETPDPPGARFGRYENGEPNGVLQEFAANDPVLKAKTAPSFQSKVDAIVGTAAHYHERGIVAVSDMMAFTKPYDDLEIFREAEKHGLKQQVPVYFEWTALRENMIPDPTDEQRTGRTKFAGVKLFADGSISNRTAWVTESYGNSNDHGFSTLAREDLQSAHEWARRNKVQVAVHAIGDKAIESIIDFFTDKEPWMGADTPSVRLEHVTLLSEEQARQMASAKMLFGATT